METIAYIYGPINKILLSNNSFHCIDCTNKRFPKDYIEKIPSNLALTNDDVESFHNYLKTFDQLPMKDIVCGTCNKIIANENTINK